MTIQRLTHIGLCVADLATALAFYRDGLGFRELARLDVAGDAPDTLLELAGTQLEAIYLERDAVRLELLHFAQPGHTGSSEPRPMNALGLTHLSLRVDDLDAATQTLASLGGTVLEQTRTSNPAFHARAIFVVDPDGTRLELVEAPGDPSLVPGQ